VSEVAESTLGGLIRDLAIYEARFAQFTTDFAVQRADGEIIAIYPTLPDAQARAKSIRRSGGSRVYIVSRLSTPWSKPLDEEATA
jgi:hypothetical protein